MTYLFVLGMIELLGATCFLPMMTGIIFHRNEEKQKYWDGTDTATAIVSALLWPVAVAQYCWVLFKHVIRSCGR